MATESPDKQPPGTLGRYQIAEELGAGAMGVVYLGVDPRLARPVAIKVIKQVEEMEPAERAQFEERFRHEAEAAGRMNHPDIVQVFDIGPNYMVMEYLDGRPLSAVLKGGVLLVVRQVTALILRVADAIDYAHRAGIVHRDIKPANIMLMSDGGVKVMDFGVARLESSNLTAVGTVVGSLRYMAPEQMMGEKVDGRADIFSLAAVAYEMLTAHSPFPGKTITEVVSRVVQGKHVPPRQADERLPEGLDPIFAKAFATRLDRRYVKAMDFARDLHDAAKPVLDLEVAHAGDPDSPTQAETAPQATEPARPRAAPVDETVMMKAPEEPEPATLRMSAPPPPADATKANETLLPSAAMLAAASITTSGIGLARLPSLVAKTLIMDPKPSKREGVLILDSDPAGAQVSVDGNPVGEAPVSDVEVSFGRHVVRMEVAGRDPVSAEIEVEHERPLKAVTFTLPLPGSREAGVRPGFFVNFGPDVTPPRRLSGPVPAYPESARERGMEGSPVVEIWVSETGDVIDVAILESAGAILDGALLEAVASWRFTPAMLSGIPVSVRVTLQHLFRR